MIKGKTKKTTIKDNPSKIPRSPFSRKKKKAKTKQNTRKKRCWAPLKKTLKHMQK